MKTQVLALPINISNLAAFTILSVLSFAVPFLFGHPQWLVGTIVNLALFAAASYLPAKYFLPLSIFPSLGILGRGILFGPFTSFLLYFLPFIWLANLILIFVFKKLGTSYPSVLFASTAKFLFLFLIANIYFSFQLVPKVFLQTMGMFQLFTALAGGVIFLVLFYGKRISRS